MDFVWHNSPSSSKEVNNTFKDQVEGKESKIHSENCGYQAEDILPGRGNDASLNTSHRVCSEKVGLGENETTKRYKSLTNQSKVYCILNISLLRNLGCWAGNFLRCEIFF